MQIQENAGRPLIVILLFSVLPAVLACGGGEGASPPPAAEKIAVSDRSNAVDPIAVVDIRLAATDYDPKTQVLYLYASDTGQVFQWDSPPDWAKEHRWKEGDLVRLEVFGDPAVKVQSAEVVEAAPSNAKGATSTDPYLKIVEKMTGSTEDGVVPTTAEPGESYVSSQVLSQDHGRQIFWSMDRRLKKDTECYQRAHLWTWGMRQNHQISSYKVFIFFARKYIREYRHIWWFHVAPAVPTEGVLKLYDPYFVKEPTEVKPWTDKMIKSKVDCPVITKYAEYQAQNLTGVCFLRIMPMYYYQPRQVKDYDEKGIAQPGFREVDLRHAKRALRFGARGDYPF